MLILPLVFTISFPVSAAGNTKMGCVISDDAKDGVIVGDTFNITVWLNTSETVDSWMIGQLSFNNADADSISINPYWKSGFYANGTIHNSAGNITDIQAFIMSGSTTNTTIFTVNFTAVKAGTCYIKLTEAEAYFGGPNVLNTTYNTSITIESAGSSSPPSQPPPSTDQNLLANAGGPYEGYVYRLITFDASESSGTITGYRWDFDDDGTYDTDWLTISTTTYAYSTAGTYIVKLQVKDDTEATDTNTTTATINEQQTEIYPPIAAANGPYTGLTYQSISFDGSSSYDIDGTMTSYIWDFGDGATGNGINPIHIYNISGLYNITLTVTDNDGLTNSNKTTATIELDSDRDGWSDDMEESYGTNATDPSDQLTDTDDDGVPDDDSPDGKYTGDSDDDNDGLEDQIEEMLGANSKIKSDVKNIDDVIAGGYLVDTDGNGQYDTFYNAISSIDTKIEVTDAGTYLIDTDGDGKWNYIYEPVSGDVTLYKEKSSVGVGVPWVIVIAIVVAAIIVIIAILSKTGYIYIENAPPTETEKNEEETDQQKKE
jgi:PKD repeat protein